MYLKLTIDWMGFQQSAAFAGHPIWTSFVKLSRSRYYFHTKAQPMTWAIPPKGPQLQYSVVQKWHIETIHPRDLISDKCQQPQSQNNVDVANRTTQRSSAERMTAQHTETTPKTKPSHVPGQPGCPPSRCQDPQWNLFMKCSGLRTRLWGRAQNGRPPKEASKTAIQEAFFEPTCIHQSLHQGALTSLSDAASKEET